MATTTPRSPTRRSTRPRSQRTRAGWGTITREQIIDQAVRRLRERGHEQLTIRGLADDLAVAPMSIYRHVRDKDDLLDEVVDRLLADNWRPRAREEDWRAWTVEAADWLRRFLVHQPPALDAYLSHPVATPNAVARMKAMTAVLAQGTSSEERAERAFAAIHTYTLGFAALESGRARSPGRDYPEGAIERQLASYTRPRQFREGLGYLLDGVTGT